MLTRRHSGTVLTILERNVPQKARSVNYTEFAAPNYRADKRRTSQSSSRGPLGSRLSWAVDTEPVAVATELCKSHFPLATASGSAPVVRITGFISFAVHPSSKLPGLLSAASGRTIFGNLLTPHLSNPSEPECHPSLPPKGGTPSSFARIVLTNQQFLTIQQSLAQKMPSVKQFSNMLRERNYLWTAASHKCRPL